MRFDSILDAIGHTPLVELRHFSPKDGVRIFAKLEGHNPTGSVKDRIAKYMVQRAEEAGALIPGKVVLESTSGNTGISLAMIAMVKGYRMVAVMPENVSPERRQLLEVFGAEVVLTPGERGSNGAIEVAQKMAAADPRYCLIYQYGNPANPQAHYETTAQEIIDDLPDVDVVVAGLGTGGTLMGVGRRLKEHNPRVKVVAAEPNAGDLVQGLRSLDEGFIPPILELGLLDRKVLVSSDDALVMTRELTRREGIFAGASSGAVLSVALRVAREMDRGNIVCIFADGGWKYLSTRLWTGDMSAVQEEQRRKILW